GGRFAEEFWDDTEEALSSARLYADVDSRTPVERDRPVSDDVASEPSEVLVELCRSRDLLRALAEVAQVRLREREVLGRPGAFGRLHDEPVSDLEFRALLPDRRTPVDCEERVLCGRLHLESVLGHDLEHRSDAL